MKHYPALDIAGAGDSDRLLAALDDFAPTALEERADAVRVFFSTPTARDAARDALDGQFSVSSLEIPDEDWARRSQEKLQPIRVGRLIVAPPWQRPPGRPEAPDLVIVIEPSMGFGTGHHATTRLCLSALQTIDLNDALVLDVGTGSGILAIAACSLGARRAIGIDNDPDAVDAAGANLALNPQVDGVRFDVADLESGLAGAFTAEGRRPDVITANLTGALLARVAALLMSAAAPGGWLILSGLLPSERDEVVTAFAPAEVAWEAHEDEWVGLILRANPSLLNRV